MKEIRLFLWILFLTGFIYPYSIYFIGNFFFNDKASGDFITHQNKLIGARLIGQQFENDSYFFSRPSAIEYHPIPSGGSNLGPTNMNLRKIVQARKEKMENAHNTKKRIPEALLFASGSGLDPHIDLEAAYFQIDRIVKARKLDPEKGRQEIKKLIDANTEHDLFFINRPYVNTLLLNLSLDEHFNQERFKEGI